MVKAGASACVGLIGDLAGEGAFARTQRSLGTGILSAAPWLMKGLSIAGTAAMFLVGGGILVHGVPAAHHWIEALAHHAARMTGIGGALEWLALAVASGLAGVVAGAVILAVVQGIKRIRGSSRTSGHAADRAETGTGQAKDS